MDMMDLSTYYAHIGRYPLPGRTRRVHLALNCGRNSTVLKFCLQLQIEQPGRILFFSAGIPDADKLMERVIEAHNKGWSGDTCIFFVPGEVSVCNYDVLERAIANQLPHWRPKNIWVFGNILPERSQVNLRYWKILELNKSIGNLQEVSYESAVELVASR